MAKDTAKHEEWLSNPFTKELIRFIDERIATNKSHLLIASSAAVDDLTFSADRALAELRVAGAQIDVCADILSAINASGK